jgi:hypothetical protein
VGTVLAVSSRSVCVCVCGARACIDYWYMRAHAYNRTTFFKILIPCILFCVYK